MNLCSADVLIYPYNFAQILVSCKISGGQGSILTWVFVIYCNDKLGPEEVLWPSPGVQA